MPSDRTAVVIGASMGGLLTARALSDSYPRILLVDRDDLPAEPAPRRGVPQGRQLHVMLARGRHALEELFPGLSQELTDSAVPLVDLHGRMSWFNDGYPMALRPSTELVAAGVSRPLLEHAVRARVAELPGVEFASGTEVLGLTATADRGRVTGVRLRDRDGAERTVAADLVVDSAGRASRTPLWLGELGYAPPEEERVQVDVTYVTRVYRHEPHHLDGLLGTLGNAVPGAPRAGLALVQENGLIAIGFSGMHGEQPPVDDDEMLTFAQTLTAPGIAEIVRSGAAVTDGVRMRFPASVRRRYERLRRFPAGYLVVADAMCSFNPIYGQGMTVAALEALLLRRLLAEGEPELSRRFFRGSSAVIDGPWSIAVGTDLRFPEVEGPRSLRVRFVNAYVHRLHIAATADPELGAAFLRVLNLLEPPTALLRPGTVLRVLRGFWRGGAATRPVAGRPGLAGDPVPPTVR
ncbi:FAD-dependent monooxygenase [Catellatospora sp. KI3]|uniref:FAD-dependent oxidoreductase n=1 Tax=Catellatospora sp. KI3 TaxID=3041620 RepID=UPI002482725F|nr:FAD-dependent monooxygenase [Catellatospora sp. KI3]MDI1461300.1 FAD-dependent monooxygenase [Catellatospora sp. KI3]